MDLLMLIFSKSFGNCQPETVLLKINISSIG